MSRSGERAVARGKPVRGWAWLGGAIALAALAVVLVSWWEPGAGERGPIVAADPSPLRRTAPPGEVVPVDGNPGWQALSEADRERATTPMAPAAEAWLRENRAVVLEVARAMDVPPVALGGLVAAEKTLLVGRVDELGERAFEVVLGSLRERDLRGWVEAEEARYRRDAADPSAASRFPVRNPYEWTLGPAQVSFRLAVQYEPVVAHRLGRPARDVKGVVRAVTSTPGNLEYAAALLAEAERAYRTLAGLDIGSNPGVLATLYHLGAPTVRARRLASDNAERRARGEEPVPPQVNYYGAFVNLHAARIREILYSD